MASLLAQFPALNFRVNSSRHRASLDCNPSVTTVVHLVRLQAEFESAALSMDLSQPNKQQRNSTAGGSTARVPEVLNGSTSSNQIGSHSSFRHPWQRLWMLGVKEKEKERGKIKGVRRWHPVTTSRKQRAVVLVILAGVIMIG